MSDSFTMSIRLRHQTADLLDVGGALGLPISTLARSGDAVRGKGGELTGSVHQESYLSSRMCTAQGLTVLEEHLEKVVGDLNLKKHITATFLDSGGTIELLVGWFFDRTSGLEIKPQTLASMGRLGIALALMAYGGPE